jgi:uncharacterized HAD superfamily protein
MRYGFDIDDTTGEFSIALLPYAFEYDRALRNTGVVDDSKYITRGMFDWSIDETRTFNRKYIQIAASHMKVKDDAVEIITLLKELGNKIFFITARATLHYDDPYQTTYDWITYNKIPYDEIIVAAADKIAVCKEMKIDVFMDDIASICAKVSNEGISTYLFNTKYNAYFDAEPQKIIRVPHWRGFYIEEEKRW